MFSNLFILYVLWFIYIVRLVIYLYCTFCKYILVVLNIFYWCLIYLSGIWLLYTQNYIRIHPVVHIYPVQCTVYNTRLFIKVRLDNLDALQCMSNVVFLAIDSRSPHMTKLSIGGRKKRMIEMGRIFSVCQM